MSDDFDFDANDLFDDFDDDDGFDDFDNEFGDDDFNDNVIEDNGFDDFDDGGFDDFDDDEFGARLDFLDDGDDFGDDDEVVAVAEDDGGNRTFLYAAIAMVIVFVLGLLLILFLVMGGFTNNAQAEQTQVALAATSTAILFENQTREAQIGASATAAVLNVTATRQAALDATETTIAQENATNEAGIAMSATALVVNATATQEAAVQSTADAAATATQVVIDEEQLEIDSATETAIAIEQTLNPPEPSVTVVISTGGSDDPTPIPVTPDGDDPTPDPEVVPTTGPAVSLPAVQQTATALAELFMTPTPNEIVPTSSDTGVVVVATDAPTDSTGTGVQPGNEALPNTGLFDDVFGGNPMMIVLIALGLLGVIIFSRTIRSTNSKEL